MAASISGGTGGPEVGVEPASTITTVALAGECPSPGGVSGTSTLNFEVLLREYTIADHESGAWLDDMLRQEPRRELGRRFPHSWIQPRVECGELGSQSHQINSANDLQDLPYHCDDAAPTAREGRRGSQSAPVASLGWPR
jgi:hypothetical protein